VRLPRTIEGDGVVLRLWREGDQPTLREILEVSKEEFGGWLPGVMSDLGDLDVFVTEVAARGEAGEGWNYAVEVDGEAVGQVSINPLADGSDEIGYWIRSDRAGAGITPRAVRALADAAFAAGRARLIIHCDEGNIRSAAVARTSGFTHIGTVELDPSLPGTPVQTGREMTWERVSP
jgi:RimJ/RimL family protein N-acetyltransferase